MSAPFEAWHLRRVVDKPSACSCHAHAGRHPVVSMGGAQGEEQWPRRHKSRGGGNLARLKSFSRPLKRHRRRKTSSIVSSRCRRKGRALRPGSAQGLPTFLTMAYIMLVNPAILEKAGMDVGAVFVATCLAAAAGSIIMRLYAKYPIALAPGMGLNAYFAFTVVPELGGNWQLALGCVLISGWLFFALSFSPLRAWLIDELPMNLKLGIAAGIGLFLALIGLQNAGIIADDPVTLVTLGDLSKPLALLAAAGFLVIAGLAV